MEGISADTIAIIVAVVTSAGGAVLAVKVDLAKLRTDMDWVKQNISRIWRKIEGEE